MRAATPVLIWIQLLLISGLVHGLVYYVSDSPEEECNTLSEPCHSISEYAESIERGLFRDTEKVEMVFLPGNHHLNEVLHVTGVISSLAMMGESASLTQVVCGQSSIAGFAVLGVRELKITNLIFESCQSIYAINISIIVIRKNIFQNNFDSAVRLNCSLLEGCTADFSNNTFLSNRASSVGGAVGLFCNSMETCTANFYNNDFINNHASSSGGAIVLHLYIAEFSGDNRFFNNSARTGGAIFSQASRIRFIGQTVLRENVAIIGGGLYAVGNEDPEVTSSVIMAGQTIIERNTGSFGGGIAINEVKLSVSGNTIIRYNIANFGAGVLTAISLFEIKGQLHVSSNSALLHGGGIYAIASNLSLSENNSFTNNSAHMGGGGVTLTGDSKLFFQTQSAVSFTNNNGRRGGAIEIEDSTPFTYCIPQEISSNIADCFYQFSDDTADVELYFKDNTAEEAGGDIFGGSVSNCFIMMEGSKSSGRQLLDRAVVSENGLSVSSVPFRVCACDNGLPNCNKKFVSLTAPPGGTVQVAAVAVGQHNGTVPAVIKAESTANKTIKFGRLEESQPASNSCTLLTYALFSPEDNVVNISLYPDGPCLSSVGTLSIIVYIDSCPPGFEFSKERQACICHTRLIRSQYTNFCNISDQTVLRWNNFWMGFNDQRGLILHPNCPFDYCISKPMNISVTDSDTQCQYNRTGKLCGGCRSNDSLLLGTSRCQSCTNIYLTLVIPFALAGIALAFCIIFLSLTVAEGTTNGLIFYANIVSFNHSAFFPDGEFNILQVFLSWVNLDLGIETCFYDGMDAYSSAWLQFVFPIYVWTLVGTLIILGHYSGNVGKILGHNPVAVLATLFLLSYTKFLRAIATPLSHTFLEYPDGNERVWLYDGNVEFLIGKHIPLFVFAMCMLVFVFLPYTFVLFFGQWILAKSKKKAFRWINSHTFRPILDAYHGPYNMQHRYWTGLLLLLRCVLYVVFTQANTPSFNLVAITCVCLGLSVFPWLNIRIYRKWYLQFLEASFILNLGVLAVATCHASDTSDIKAQTAIVSVSMGIVFIEFIGIIIYHCLRKLKSKTIWERMTAAISPFKNKTDCGVQEEQESAENNNSNQSSSCTTTTVIVLENSKLREPVLAFI